MSIPIPHPPGIPVLGNLFDVDPNNTWWSLKTLAEKYGEIFSISVLGNKIVFVASAALAEEICDEKRFRKYVGGPIKEIRYAVHDALFTAYEREAASWGVAHRVMAPLLSADAVASHFREVLSCTDELVTKWSSLGDDTNKIQPFPDLNLLNLEATTLTLFGKKLNCITADGPPHPMLQAMEDSTSEAMKRPTRPKLLNFLVYGSKFRRATKAMRAYAQDVIDYRKANPNPDRHDLLWAMQTAKDPETGKSLTDSQVVDEIISMPIGSSTAPCAVAAGILFLTQNPHVVTRAREEIDAVVGEGELTEEHIPRLQYMAGVVRETLRLSFAAPGFNIEPIPREGDKSPVLLGGGKYEIAHDQAMIIVLAGVNRDPAVFEEPTAFRPERMVGEAFEKLPAGVKKWFGNGKRECIGKHWAWEFLVVVMTELIRKLDFEAAEPGYAMKQDGWFNVRPIDLSVKVKPRAV